MAKSLISSWDEFITTAHIIHQSKYAYNRLIDFKKISDRVEIICHDHGLFIQQGSDHLRGHGCKKCGRITSAKKNTKKLFRYEPKSRKGATDKCLQDMINRFNIVHKDKYDYSLLTDHDFNNKLATKGKNKISIGCPIHGVFQQVCEYHRGGNSCQKCKNEVIGAIQNSKDRLTTKQWIEKAHTVHGHVYNYSSVTYEKYNSYVAIICRKHGEFNQRACYHLAGSGCPTCARTKASPISQRWLDNLNVEGLLREHVIIHNKCKFIVDGYDPQTNTVYEFLGDYWHGNPKVYNLQEVMTRKKKTFGVRHQTFGRFDKLFQSGYKVWYIWEYDYHNGISEPTVYRSP